MGWAQPTKFVASRGSATRRNARNLLAVNRLRHNSRTPGVGGVTSSLSDYEFGMNEGLLRTGQISLARTGMIIAVQDFDFDFAIRIGRPSWCRVVTQPVLCAQLAVDQIENHV